MWKECTVNSSYEISDDGDIRRKSTGQILKQKLSKDNNLLVNLSFGRRGCVKYFRVHRLVAEAFIPNPDNLPWVVHIDGNTINNNVSNLKWAVTKNPVQLHGENSHNSKLTQEQVDYCRRVYKPRDKKYGLSALAEQFNVSKPTIHYAIKGITYKD